LDVVEAIDFGDHLIEFDTLLRIQSEDCREVTEGPTEAEDNNEVNEDDLDEDWQEEEEREEDLVEEEKKEKEELGGGGKAMRMRKK